MSDLLSPLPALRPGDTIAVVAPSGPVPQDRLKAGLKLLSKEFRLNVSSDIFREQGFLAGDDQRRAEEFNDALANPEVRAIWAARGGYGASRLLPHLDEDAMRRDPKVIVGFSDITVLLGWAAKLGFRSMHAPVVTQLADLESRDCQWAIDMLLGKLQGQILANGLSGSALSAEGILLGGNLSLLAHLCGTSHAPTFKGSLCIVEDVGEKPYALDRYFTQLLAQKRGLSQASAVLLGDFSNCGPEGCAHATLEKRLKEESIPCLSGVPIGHGLRNRAFPHGAMASVDRGELRLIESVTVPNTK